MKPRLYNDPKATLADDSELKQIAAYVSDAMSDTERGRFENRFCEDEAFHNRVAPFLTAWYEAEPIVRVIPAPATAQRRRIVRPAFAVTGIAAAVMFTVCTLTPRPQAATPGARAAYVRPVHKTPSTSLAAATAARHPTPTVLAQAPARRDTVVAVAPTEMTIGALPGVGLSESSARLVVEAPTVILRMPTVPRDSMAEKEFRRLLGEFARQNGDMEIPNSHWPHWPNFRWPWQRKPIPAGVPTVKPPTLEP
jgi:hypothetical protein